jgi:6-phosphofructokinase 1
MVALDPPTILTVPMDDALGIIKGVPLDADSVLTARDLGVCLGD